MHSDVIFRVLGRAAFETAQSRGAFMGSADDLRDGFIHFSAPHQLTQTIAKHYAGEADLMLLWVDATQLASALRWEPSRGGDVFPHLYGPLPMSAVLRAEALLLHDNGRHVIPPL